MGRGVLLVPRRGRPARGYYGAVGPARTGSAGRPREHRSPPHPGLDCWRRRPRGWRRVRERASPAGLLAGRPRDARRLLNFWAFGLTGISSFGIPCLTGKSTGLLVALFRVSSLCAHLPVCARARAFVQVRACECMRACVRAGACVHVRVCERVS
jgi:hypothetical protein